MASLPETMFARRAHNRNGSYFSLRVVYPTSGLPGDRSSEFGRVRLERDGWNAFSTDEDFDRALKAACHRAGRDCTLPVLLAEIRSTYVRWYHEADVNGMTDDEIAARVMDENLPQVDREQAMAAFKQRGLLPKRRAPRQRAWNRA